MARHTFATTVTLTNGVPIETVSKLLGHRSIRTTQIYAKVINEKIAEDMGSLATRIDGKFELASFNLKLPSGCNLRVRSITSSIVIIGFAFLGDANSNLPSIRVARLPISSAIFSLITFA